MTFDALALHPLLLQAVSEEGYETPTPIQEQAIPHGLAGRDILGCAQTGTGKTAAFALPILHRLMEQPPQDRRRPTRALVLSPTRELTAQIGESFSTYGRHTDIRNVVIYGGVRQRAQVSALRAGVDVIVATPGRLMDLMQQGHVDLRSIQTFVLDEADRMLDMGFIDDIRQIVRSLPRQRQTLFFSATMPPAIEYLADSILNDPVEVHVSPVSSAAETVDQSVYYVERLQKPHMLVELIRSSDSRRVLVFTRTKHSADRVTMHLVRSGIKAEAIHGDKNQRLRDKAMEMFKSDQPPVLVATDIAARGLDIDEISHVVNYDVPHEPEAYVHRIGRTGRAGASGLAVTFCDIEERSLLRTIEKLIRKTIRVEDVPATVPTLGQLLRGETATKVTLKADAVAAPRPAVPPVSTQTHSYSGFGRMGVGVASRRSKRRRR